MIYGTAVENLTIAWRGGHFLNRVLRIEAWLDARASRLVLYRLDSRGLADIGLTEADLGRADPATTWHGLLGG